jgi:hypothetical protein
MQTNHPTTGVLVCSTSTDQKLTAHASTAERATVMNAPSPLLPQTSLVLIALLSISAGQEYFIAPDGKPGNTGSAASPWDIASAWSGAQTVTPGSTLWMKAGTYRHPDRSWGGQGYTLALEGTEAAPITIRPEKGARVTIDGSVEVKPNSRCIVVQDLELTVSETAKWDRQVTAGGDKPVAAIDLPRGGINIIGGSGSKFINLVIHDTASGVGFWRTATDAEISGCIICNNGSIGPDRYHGPGIYTQNETGVKWLTDNILFGNYSTTIQAYGSSNAWVDGFRIIGNIAFAPVKAGGRAQILVGGGRPSRDMVVSANLLYEVPLQIGYTAPHNEDLVARDNFVVNAGLSINRYRIVKEENNRSIAADAPRPAEAAEVFLRPNKYDPNRAHLAIFNWKKTPTVQVSLQPFLKAGEKFRIVTALDFFGKPLLEGVFDGNPLAVSVPIEERTGHGEFCAYIIFRN